MNHHILTTLGTVSRRRLLIGLLLVLALAGGLWWNSTRLNETERKLVGVWEQTSARDGSRSAMILLPNRRLFYTSFSEGKWVEAISYGERWRASSDAWTCTLPWQLGYPRLNFNNNRLTYIRARLLGCELPSEPIVLLTRRQFVYGSAQGAPHIVLRTEDSELLRLFERLSAGKSP